MAKMYYGLTRQKQAYEMAKDVVKVLGGGKNAELLLLETAMQETKLGTYKDTTDYAAGNGLCQDDKFPFEDRKLRLMASSSGKKWLKDIEENFDIVWQFVEWRELEHSPLLSIISCRLTYKLVPEAIPDTVEGRAAYWKKYYNTVAGKGTEEEYIENAKKVKTR